MKGIDQCLTLRIGGGGCGGGCVNDRPTRAKEDWGQLEKLCREQDLILHT